MLVLPDLSFMPIVCPTRDMLDWPRICRFDSPRPSAKAYVPAPLAPMGARQLAADRHAPVCHELSIRVRVRCIM
jgi:hypothetical protein